MPQIRVEATSLLPVKRRAQPGRRLDLPQRPRLAENVPENKGAACAQSAPSRPFSCRRTLQTPHLPRCSCRRPDSGASGARLAGAAGRLSPKASAAAHASARPCSSSRETGGVTEGLCRGCGARELARPGKAPKARAQRASLRRPGPRNVAGRPEASGNKKPSSREPPPPHGLPFVATAPAMIRKKARKRKKMGGPRGHRLAVKLFFFKSRQCADQVPHGHVDRAKFIGGMIRSPLPRSV